MFGNGIGVWHWSLVYEFAKLEFGIGMWYLLVTGVWYWTPVTGVWYWSLVLEFGTGVWYYYWSLEL